MSSGQGPRLLPDYDGVTTPQIADRRRDAEQSARVELAAGRMSRAREGRILRQNARMEREQQASRDLAEHRRRLARELAWERAQSRPNPWIGPDDPGYVPPLEWAIERGLHENEMSRERALRLSASMQAKVRAHRERVLRG